MTAAEFKPTFSQTAILCPNGILALVDPLFCASDQCAKDLCALLADLHPEITHAGPFWFSGGGVFSQVGLVPWLLFPADNGPQQLLSSGAPAVAINAGVLSRDFTRNYPPALAEQFLRAHIAQTIKDMTT